VKQQSSNWPRALVGAVALTGLVACPARAAPEVPAPPAPPAAVRPLSDADLDAQLQAARKRLEEAAHEVAQLSSQISGSMIEQVMPYVEGGHAIIGVQLGPDPAGARVREVSPGGPAAEAGMRVGDVIVALNGSELKGADPARQVVRLMRDVKPDARVRVRVLRDGQAREFTLTARAGPGVLARVQGLPDVEFGPWPELRGAFMFRGPLSELELATLTPRLGSYFGADKGVLVIRAPEDGALKLEDGDVILDIDGRAPLSVSHATRIIGSYQPGEKLALRIMRQHKTQELQLTVPESSGHEHKNLMWRSAPHPGVPAEPKMLILGRDEA
jgi:S1-C subfamily serine protease